jgi:hypothetical protein
MARRPGGLLVVNDVPVTEWAPVGTEFGQVDREVARSR